MHNGSISKWLNEWKMAIEAISVVWFSLSYPSFKLWLVYTLLEIVLILYVLLLQLPHYSFILWIVVIWWLPLIFYWNLSQKVRNNLPNTVIMKQLEIFHLIVKMSSPLDLDIFKDLFYFSDIFFSLSLTEYSSFSLM